MTTKPQSLRLQAGRLRSPSCIFRGLDLAADIKLVVFPSSEKKKCAGKDCVSKDPCTWNVPSHEAWSATESHLETGRADFQWPSLVSPQHRLLRLCGWIPVWMLQDSAVSYPNTPHLQSPREKITQLRARVWIVIPSDNSRVSSVGFIPQSWSENETRKRETHTENLDTQSQTWPKTAPGACKVSWLLNHVWLYSIYTMLYLAMLVHGNKRISAETHRLLLGCLQGLHKYSQNSLVKAV